MKKGMVAHMPYTIENFHFVAVGQLQGTQEAPDLPLAVAPTRTGLAQPRGSERVKTPHHKDFYTKWHGPCGKLLIFFEIMHLVHF